MDVINYDRYISRPGRLLLIILIIAAPSLVKAQDNVLNNILSVKVTDTSISNILKSITRKTGYYFTFDTELVEPERLISIRMEGHKLRTILDTIFHDKLLDYSIIEDHIIIYQSVSETTPLIREEGKEPVYILSGIITDAANGQPLPYATIGIKAKGKGTVSNYEGEFYLKLTKDFLDDTLVISYLGYYNRIIPVNQAVNSYYNISLTRLYVPIPEVIIRNREPVELIRNAKKQIPENYGRTPAKMDAFYRESVSKRNKLLQYSEAVLELYKSAYSATIYNDQIKIYKSRQINNLEQSDTLTFKLRSGLDGCLQLDAVKNPLDFLMAESFEYYDYSMTDIINIGDEAAFVIDFKQKETVDDIPLPEGSIYINTGNLGIHGIDFKINEAYINMLDETFIQQAARGYRVKVRSAEYRVKYRYIDNRYYLNHVRGDLSFYARKRNRLFGSTYDIFFEMAITGIDTVNAQRFPREERAPLHSIFSETIKGYDREFWGTDNFVRPEESITDALSRINARLGEYRSNNSR